MKKFRTTNSHKIKKLTAITKEVIKSCSLDNGGIVAADSTKSYYPQAAKNYFYVWPRDASFACIAADVSGMKGIQKKFFNWCFERAEGFNQKGLFYEKYYPNGLKASASFQPDQTGTVLFALWHHYKDNKNHAKQFHNFIKTAADGICKIWRKTHFNEVTNDLWEERFCFPDLSENFTYSLAACIKGLACANAFLPDKKWITVSNEMRNQLDKHFLSYFVRSYGDLPDERIDASALGLVYPFEIYDSNDQRIEASVREIEKRLCTNGGIHRYEHGDCGVIL